MIIDNHPAQAFSPTVNFFLQRRSFCIKQGRRFCRTGFHANRIISIAQVFHFCGNNRKGHINRRGAKNPPLLSCRMFQNFFPVSCKFFFIFNARRSFNRHAIWAIHNMLADKLDGANNFSPFFGAFFLRNLNDNALPFVIIDIFEAIFFGIQKSIVPIINVYKKTDFIMSQFNFTGNFSQIDVAFSRSIFIRKNQFQQIAVFHQSQSCSRIVFFINYCINTHFTPAPSNKFLVSYKGRPTTPL